MEAGNESERSVRSMARGAMLVTGLVALVYIRPLHTHPRTLRPPARRSVQFPVPEGLVGPRPSIRARGLAGRDHPAGSDLGRAPGVSTTLAATARSQVWLADLASYPGVLVATRTGYGAVGWGAELGYEGRAIEAAGVGYTHGVSTHAGPKHMPAFVRFNLTEAGMQMSKWCASIDAKVAINDRNNRAGRAGSGLTFRLYGDGRVLWQSSPIERTGVIETASAVSVRGVTLLTLEVAAVGSSACSHSVWLDPALLCFDAS